MELYRYFSGTLPLLVSVPHAGTHVPEGIFARLTPEAQRLPDTDWHVDRLYDFARGMGAHFIAATHSRYVVDLNRAPDDTKPHTKPFNTNVCPTQMFDTSPIYRNGKAPDAAEVSERIGAYWQPYHDKLRTTLDALRATSDKVVIFEAHSIRSRVPSLFDGELPNFNFGTARGKSADAALTERLAAIGKASPYPTVVNQRFIGGYITHHYGQPERGIHGVQLEMTWKNYMEEAYPYTYDEAKASTLQVTLREIITAAIEWVKS